MRESSLAVFLQGEKDDRNVRDLAELQACMGLSEMPCGAGGRCKLSPGRRVSWDIVYEAPSGKAVVEFDGDEHYRHTLKIKTTGRKTSPDAQNVLKRLEFVGPMSLILVRHSPLPTKKSRCSRRKWQRICSGVGVILLTVCIPIAGAAENSTRCSIDHVVINPITTDAAMSHVEITFRVTNQNSIPCSLVGKPVVQAQDAQRRPLALIHSAPPNKSTSENKSLILKPNHSALFSISFGTSDAYLSKDCPHRASSLLIRLPGVAGSKRIASDLDICTKLYVSPLVPGSQGFDTSKDE